MKKISILFLVFLCASPCIPQEYSAGDHELFLMPTAYTIPKGASYFTDYELFLLNYTHAFTLSTHAGIFSLFPVTTQFLNSFSIGLKQNYYSKEKTGCAFWATYTPKASMLNMGNVFSFGKKQQSLHFAISTTKPPIQEDYDEWMLSVMMGYRYDLSEKTSLIFEFANLDLLKAGSDFPAMLGFGMRFRTKKMAWEVAAVRPFENIEKLLFFPLLKATITF